MLFFTIRIRLALLNEIAVYYDKDEIIILTVSRMTLYGRRAFIS